MDEVARLREKFNALVERYNKALLDVEVAQQESERLDREIETIRAQLLEAWHVANISKPG